MWRDKEKLTDIEVLLLNIVAEAGCNRVGYKRSELFIRPKEYMFYVERQRMNGFSNAIDVLELTGYLENKA